MHESFVIIYEQQTSARDKFSRVAIQKTVRIKFDIRNFLPDSRYVTVDQ